MPIWRRIPVPLALSAVLALSAAAAAPAATPLRDVDTRARDSGPLSAQERRARAALEERLGDEGVVATDRISGGARLVARTDGFLTGRNARDPAAIALAYVRAREAVFGLGDDELRALRLTRRVRSRDGITHLAYEQTHRGIGAYDNVLLASVDDDGRLVSIGGSAVDGLRVDSILPRLDAFDALRIAREEVGGVPLAPRARRRPGAERATTFAGGDTARLTLFSDGALTRLAWRVIATGDHDFAYELVVDTGDGTVLKRRSLTDLASNALVYRNHPGAANGGTAQTVDLAADPSWLSQSVGHTRLSGNNAHAYVDADATDGRSDDDLEVPRSSGTDWLYPLTAFSVPGQSCSPDCTWNSTLPSTRAENRNQATTQLFYLVNTFHDHLRDAPIGFTHAAGGFELVDADGGGPGVGGDPVKAETDNYLNPDGDVPVSLNNASMTTMPDGTPPRLQMFLFGATAAEPGIPSLNAADTADIVYHEYAHGLTNRSVGSGVGLDANQSRAMGEGWSDWYALDFLELQGLRPDAPGVPGEMTIGSYLIAGGFRTQGADCPVGSNAAACPGRGPGNQGGYTLGDMGSVSKAGFRVHADGEIWLETLWDLRAALGAATAERLVTSGLRLAPNNPSFLEARDAILLADRVSGGAHYVTLWSVFAARGMGYGASTTSSAATSAVEAFDVPPRLLHDATTISDAAPGGDGDGVAEPGETISLAERLRNPLPTAATGVTGTLGSSAVTVAQPNSTWPTIAAGLAATGSPAFGIAIPAGADCDSSAALSLAVTTDQGSFTLPLTLPIGSVASSDVPKVVPGSPAGVSSTLTFGGSGPVHGLEVRIPRLAHTWVGDLIVRLRSPQGTSVTLIDRPGAGAEGAGGADLVDVVLDDDAATAIESIPSTAPIGGYSGRFRPDQPLSTFDGEERQGAWTLTVVDAFPSLDSGTLFSWGLRPSDTGVCNRRPVAVDDAYGTAGDQPLQAAGLLANDSDPDADALSAVKDSDPAHGTVALAADGSFSYAPAPGFRGTDSFTYRARDAEGRSSAPATVRIGVGNRVPAAADDAYSAVSGATLSGASVLANDGDPNGDALNASLVSRPAHGTLALSADGTFRYTPARGFTGRDAFTYRASDGTDVSAPATATIDVGPAGPTAPAKLEVLRAGVRNGRLDVLARITTRARGRVDVRYRSSGRTTRFSVPIVDGTIRISRSLPAAQRRKPTGIFTLAYAGSAAVQPDSVTLRAASGKALLVRRTTRIDAKGRLLVSGTIARAARGVVRVRLGYSTADGVRFVTYRARIVSGRWSLATPLPAEAAAAGGQLSIQFTGYEPRLIRGEQIAKRVTPGS